MRLFPLMFFRKGKRFRNLVKMGPAQQILYLSQCSEKNNPVCESKIVVEVQGTNRVVNLMENIQPLGNVSTEKQWREDKVTDLVAPAPLSCTHMSSLGGSCPVLSLDISFSYLQSHLCAKQMYLNIHPAIPRESSVGHFWMPKSII